MPTRKVEPESFNIRGSLVVAYATNDRINRYLIDNLAPAAWTAKPEGGKGRTIAAMVAHINNVRLMWLKSAGWPLASARKLDGDTCSRQEAAEALLLSSEAACSLEIVDAWACTGGTGVPNWRTAAGTRGRV